MNANNATLELTEPGTDLMPEKTMTLKTTELADGSKAASRSRPLVKKLLLPLGICAGVLVIKVAIVAVEIIVSLNALYAGMPT